MQSCSKVCDNLVRRKPAEDWLSESPFKRCLTALDLTFLGVGSVVGAGLYVVTGELARDMAGPAVILSFLLAGFAAFFSGICYAEFGCRIPKAGSAYIYSYVSVGEFWAFVVGWNMILEYYISAASVARACSEYINSFAQGYIYRFFMEDIGTWNVPALGSFPDFLAAALAVTFTVVVSLGVTKSSLVNKVMTFINLSVIAFIIFTGLYYVDGKNWTSNFAPYGVSGVLRAAGSCFYAFVGFDVISSAAEEAVNPKHSVPLSIILTLTISFLAYFGVAIVLTLIMPYDQLNRFAPLAEAFAQRGFSAAKYVVATGGLCATISTLLSQLFAAPRVVYSMASDGLVLNWFAHVHEKSKVPVRASVTGGILVAILALLLDIKQLVEMLSIGTIFAYTMVAIAVLVSRYTPGVQSVLLEKGGTRERTNRWLESICCRPGQTESKDGVLPEVSYQRIESNYEGSPENLIKPDEKTSFRARVGTFVLTSSITGLAICLTRTGPQLVRGDAWIVFLCSVFGLVIIGSLIYIMRQPRNSATFPFMVPGIPVVPAISIFFNVLLLVMLNHWTYIRFSVWMTLGLLLYFFYGYSHSIQAVRPGEGSESPFILSQTPDFGNKIEEYPPSSSR
ncbi:cationic amino acid transporter 3-like isoform X1 [Montipora foliosa]|uniref:cationic amino acid transporter 3-like isoform X1 n=1 Tax=Montipora foliosa TaxID=591990 RepID=UPI0035F162CC